MSFEVGKTGDGGVDLETRRVMAEIMAEPIPQIGRSAVHGRTPEELIKDFVDADDVPVPYGGSEGARDIPNATIVPNDAFTNRPA